MNYINFFMLILFSFAIEANDNLCLEQIGSIESNYNNIEVIPGYVAGQIQIDKEARGLNRFRSKSKTILVDAERVPLFSQKRKVFSPDMDLDGYKFEGVHLATRTHRKDHRGVEIFDINLKLKGAADSDEQFTLFSIDRGPYYFKNFALSALPYEVDTIEGPLYLLSHGVDREVEWSQHGFISPQMVNLSSAAVLEIYFETDFDNTNGGDGTFLLNWIENSTSGVRIDTCVYFLVSKRIL